MHKEISKILIRLMILLANEIKDKRRLRELEYNQTFMQSFISPI